MPECKVCSRLSGDSAVILTDEIFDINLYRVFICSDCANQIALQQLKELIHFKETV